MPTHQIAAIYLAARQRIDDLVRPLGPDELRRPVPSCPGWTVHGTVSHLAATPEWAAAGRLRGLPSDEDTAQQVAELAEVPTPEVLDRWAASAPALAEMVAAADIWPPAIDVDFEVLRARLGRRSRAQLAAMDWSPEPGALLDELAVFTPAEADIDE